MSWLPWVMSDSPSALAAGTAMIKALRVRRPRPSGSGSVDHTDLAAVLRVLGEEGIAGISGRRSAIASYRDALARVDPDSLTREESLAFWLNLYNAGALDLASATLASGRSSVLRIPGAFDTVWAEVAGEALSLNDIEHGKIRRFGDPRIHSALVCGSASCPTLRFEPYAGHGLDAQLDHQMRQFLDSGGAYREGDRLLLSRIFLWYGGDFVRPHRMPTFVPASRKAVLRSLQQWLEPDLIGLPVGFQSYDWGLACAIR